MSYLQINLWSTFVDYFYPIIFPMSREKFFLSEFYSETNWLKKGGWRSMAISLINNNLCDLRPEILKKDRPIFL